MMIQGTWARTSVLAVAVVAGAGPARGGEAARPSPSALGGGAADLVYTPVAPCRIIDTRVAGGVLMPGLARNFFVAGDDFFPLQGGTDGGCGVPSGPATAAIINFVAVQPAGPGNLRAWAFGGTVPNASVINYASVAGLNIANGVAVPLCDQALTACGPGDLTVRADASATHLVADVVGYFRAVEFHSSSVNSIVDPDSFRAISTAGCHERLSLTVVAPSPGRVVVRGYANLAINHVAGTGDSIFTYIGASPTDCPADSGRARMVTGIAASAPTMSLSLSANPVRTFDVTAGTHTFYLNIDQAAGLGGDFIAASMEATFHPN
jgi:hypothetical protein